MDDVRKLGKAVVELTRRIERLEGAAPSKPPPVTETDDVFWVLDGIKQRVPEPGAVVYAGAVTVPAGPVEWQIGLPTDELLDSDWSAHAASLAALASPIRLQLLQSILNGVANIADLSHDQGIGTTGQLYHHLNQLVAQGWVKSSQRGHYAIPQARVVPLLAILAATRSF